MNCPNCGTFNNQDSKFCMGCGQSLQNMQTQITNMQQASQQVPVQNMDNTLNQNVSNFQTVTTPNNPQNNNMNSTTKVSFMGYFFMMLAVIMKPFTAFKEELNKLSQIKTSGILALIVSGLATLVKLITSMLNVVRVKSYSFSSGYTTTWEWDNLKKLDYVKVIGKNFLIYLGVIVVIALVYYIVSLIAKKQTNFSRLLGISSLAVVPMLVCYLILSPLLSMLWVQLAIPIVIIGFIYTIVLLYEGMNSEVLLDGNAKYYFNLVCLSILAIAGLYFYMNLMISSIYEGLGNLGDYGDLFEY